MKTNKRVTDHKNYHPADYQYLREKGYNDTEILAIWDRDREQGHTEPQTHVNNPFFTAK